MCYVLLTAITGEEDPLMYLDTYEMERKKGKVSAEREDLDGGVELSKKDLYVTSSLSFVLYSLRIARAGKT